MTVEVKICMGSACFAKGNQDNLEFIKEYTEQKGINADVTIIGALCENKCNKGPRIIVDGTEYINVNKEKIEEIFR